MLEAAAAARLLRLLAARVPRPAIAPPRRHAAIASDAASSLTEPLPVVADADPLGTTTATVTVEPARLRVARRSPQTEVRQSRHRPGVQTRPRIGPSRSPPVGAGAGRALTTTYLPVLLERIDDSPSLIGVVMTVNAVTGFAVPLVVGLWSDRARAGRRLPFMIGRGRCSRRAGSWRSGSAAAPRTSRSALAAALVVHRV